MAFGDWDTFTSGNFLVTTEVGSGAIVGSESLLLDNTGAGGNGVGLATPSVGSGLTRGITAGRMRTIMRKTAGSTSPSNSIGIYFLSNATNPIGSSKCYTLGIDNNGDVNLWYRGTNISVVSILLATSPGLITDITSDFTIEVAWIYDVPTFGGTRIEVKTGLALDYSDLTFQPALAVNETTFALSATSGEGLFATSNGGFDQSWIFDKTQLYSIAIT